VPQGWLGYNARIRSGLLITDVDARDERAEVGCEGDEPELRYRDFTASPGDVPIESMDADSFDVADGFIRVIRVLCGQRLWLL
jgi:hypothetical protein